MNGFTIMLKNIGETKNKSTYGKKSENGLQLSPLSLFTKPFMSSPSFSL
jgi:hypothetical protein